MQRLERVYAATEDVLKKKKLRHDMALCMKERNEKVWNALLHISVLVL